eukprot:GHVS01090613.1.p1 GENE.GHVS01090613.1~~GHVS01090613.1.p1  ORF type:complete len:361 (+),score=44.68 GHVS01090613.1:347-1429(+)
MSATKDDDHVGLDSPPDLFVGTLLGGAVSGAVSRRLLHPLDTCKAKLQVVKAFDRLTTTTTTIDISQCSKATKQSYYYSWQHKGLAGLVFRTLRKEGLRGFYRGIGVSSIGSVPATCLYFSAYEGFRPIVRAAAAGSIVGGVGDGCSHKQHVRLITDFTAGFLAEAVSCVLWVPIDVSKERLQTQADLKMTNYRSSWDALRTIIKVDGISQLYKGYAATLCSFGPMSALYFMFYEQFKQIAIRRQQDGSAVASTTSGGDRIPFVQSLVCGSLAGALASWLTSPLDVVKLRLQVQRGSPKSTLRTNFVYTGFFQGLYRMFADEGLSGAFRGSLVRSCYHTPATAITIAIMERTRYFYMYEF